MGDHAVRIEGVCEPAFRHLRDAFAENFRSRGELGAAVAVVQNGHLVVDLWGGVRDARSGAPWERDTIVCMMSVSKGIAGLCVAMLADRGLLSLDDPIARHWPEFAAGGKERITVRQALGHLACIPVVDRARSGDFYDWDAMVGVIAAQEPLWPVGSRQFYHSSTLGFMAGELVRRITGKTIGAFLRDEVAKPLGADYAFGLSPEDQARCATMVPSEGNVIGAAKRLDPTTIEARMWAPLPAAEDFNSTAWRSAEIPSVNGHGAPRGVARIYGALASADEPLLRAESLAQFLIEQTPTPPPPDGSPLRMAVAFMLNSPPHRAMGPNMATFGHSGAGGAQSFCDPVAGLGFCYGPNRMHDGADTGARAVALIEALYASL